MGSVEENVAVDKWYLGEPSIIVNCDQKQPFKEESPNERIEGNLDKKKSELNAETSVEELNLMRSEFNNSPSQEISSSMILKTKSLEKASRPVSGIPTTTLARQIQVTLSEGDCEDFEEKAQLGGPSSQNLSHIGFFKQDRSKLGDEFIEWDCYGEDEMAESLPGKPISHHGRWTRFNYSFNNSPEQDKNQPRKNHKLSSKNDLINQSSFTSPRKENRKRKTLLNDF